MLLRIVNSPFGRVLQAIRENEFRAEAIGYRTVVYRTHRERALGRDGALAGALLALWLRYTGPATTLSFEIMIDILLMVVIGGMGTMYGAVIGATLFIIAQNYLQDLMKLASEATTGMPLLPTCCIPTAGCCGSACCSCSASTSSRPESWAKLRQAGSLGGVSTAAFSRGVMKRETNRPASYSRHIGMHRQHRQHVGRRDHRGDHEGADDDVGAPLASFSTLTRPKRTSTITTIGISKVMPKARNIVMTKLK